MHRFWSKLIIIGIIDIFSMYKVTVEEGDGAAEGVETGMEISTGTSMDRFMHGEPNKSLCVYPIKPLNMPHRSPLLLRLEGPRWRDLSDSVSSFM